MLLLRTTVVSMLLLSSAATAEAKKPPPQQEDLAQAASESFTEPDAIHSADGVLRATLAVQYADNVIRGTHVHLRSYNGHVAGPTLRAKPGDVLKLRLENQLPPIAEEPDHNVNVPHGLNSTNLHTHGLHVSPEGNSDNVYLDIKPGQAQEYEIKIPENHVPGTFWYHPHKHGSVALQVASGMAGALIIEGGLDDVPAIKHAQERTFLFQQIPFDDEGQVEKLSSLYDGHAVTHWHQSGRFTTINGVALPVITLRPGEVQRWRLIHGGIHESILVRLDGHKLHEIAADGIPLGKLVPQDEIELQPGNRADVLVKASATPGVYLLRDGALPAERALSATADPEKFLAKVVVTGPPKEMALPTSTDLAALAPFKPITDDEVQGHRTTVVFGEDEKHQPPRYFINDRQFDPDATARRVLLGTAEEWTLSAPDDNHPFHLHANPFEVIRHDPQSGKIVERTWRDTVLVAAKSPVTIRVRYQDFAGKTVFHCHNLAHEDLGMMQNIEMVRTVAELTQPQLLPKPWRPAAWKLPDGAGQLHRSDDFNGRPTLLAFYLGGSCPRCLQQLKMLRDYAAAAGSAAPRVIAISPDSPAAIARTESWLHGGEKVLLLSDETTEVFRQFHCLDGGDIPRHGLFLINADGEVIWSRISDTAVTDPAIIPSIR
ncbi:MAG: hypothetical protein QOF78_2338 [Phycisphaerales bacterium]|jgi:FtsP/CotA-like multicopper oxidase with cupredoxin domain/peroxiredoxin|nr:hypothetical protein [Phycisphaerales bacterium]